MLRVLVLAFVLATGSAARADERGYYFTESFGGGGYSGGLAAYGGGGFRLQFGIGHRRGLWSVETVAGAIINDFLYTDCYGEECNVDTSHDGAFGFLGFDVKRSWPLAQSRWSRLNARVALHAGPRYFIGTDALTGYSGPGLNAGATVEANVWVLGYFLDLGVDAMSMTMPVDGVTGTSPHLMFGVKVGWL